MAAWRVLHIETEKGINKREGLKWIKSEHQQLNTSKSNIKLDFRILHQSECTDCIIHFGNELRGLIKIGADRVGYLHDAFWVRAKDRQNRRVQQQVVNVRNIHRVDPVHVLQK